MKHVSVFTDDEIKQIRDKKCKKHPRYKGVRASKECGVCFAIWFTKNFRRK